MVGFCRWRHIPEQILEVEVKDFSTCSTMQLLSGLPGLDTSTCFAVYISAHKFRRRRGQKCSVCKSTIVDQEECTRNVRLKYIFCRS
jgi:hypothetical protein